MLAALILVIYFNFTSSVTLFGNSYTIDPLSNFMKILVLISVLFTMLISNTYLERLKIAKFEYPIIILLSTLGMFVMISANNLIVFYKLADKTKLKYMFQVQGRPSDSSNTSFHKIKLKTYRIKSMQL